MLRIPRLAVPIIAAMIAADLCAVAPVLAQAPAPQRVEDENVGRARAAWEALPLAERIAIQEDLVWATPYRGTSQGEFGRLTFNALRMITAKRPGAVEAVLAPAERAALAAEAAKARAAIGFALVSETRSGATLGVPRKLLPRRLDVESGARFESGDRSTALETFRMREAETPLAVAYEALRAPQPNRRVTYSVLRPDFFVIVSETQSQASYIRAARGSDGAEMQIRGFRLVWPKTQQARYEALAVAVSNSFSPFSAKTEPAPDRKPEPSASANTLAPARDHVVSIALALGGGQFVAILPHERCETARIGDAAARLLRQDGPSSLAVFEAPDAKAEKLKFPPAASPDGRQALVIFAQENGRTADFAVAPGETRGGKDAAQVHAALPAAAAGALVLSRDGQFLGLVAPVSARQPNAPPPASRPLALADRILAFADASIAPDKAPASQGAAALAAAARPSLDVLRCQGEARPAAN